MTENGPQHITAGRAAALLALSVGVLGCSWPVLKIVTHALTPLWFNTLRMIFAAAVFAAVVAARGKLRWPARQDMPVVLGLGVLQFGVMSSMVVFGVSMVGAGRSAILVYTNSIWVTAGAILILGERISRARAIGLMFGIVGLAVLFNPSDFDWSDRHVLIGNGSVVAGSVMWAVALLQVRGHRWSADPLELLPYQTLIGAIVTLPFAMAFEGVIPTIQWAWAPAIAFIAVVLGATCLGFWGLVMAGRSLPATAVTLGQLATPVIGVGTSFLLVGEIPGRADIAGLALIVVGVAIGATLGRARAPKAALAPDTRG